MHQQLTIYFRMVYLRCNRQVLRHNINNFSIDLLYGSDALHSRGNTLFSKERNHVKHFNYNNKLLVWHRYKLPSCERAEELCRDTSIMYRLLYNQ